MKKLLLIICLLFTSLIVAQEHFIGIKGGTSWTDVNTRNVFFGRPGSEEMRNGFNAGIAYEYHMDNRFNIGVDLLYSERGFSQFIDQTDGNGTPLPGVQNTEYNFDYLVVPIKGGVSFGNKLSGIANVGLTPAILISSFVISPEVPGLREEQRRKLTNLAARFDIGVIFEVGGDYEIVDGIHIFSTVGYQTSFTSLTTDEFAANGEARHYGIQLFLGAKYQLNNSEE